MIDLLKSMSDLFTNQQEIRPIYLILPIIIYFLVEYLRKLKKFYYSPVYFPFAFEALNPRLAIFYGTNLMYESSSMSEADIKDLEREIKTTALISALISAFIVPTTIGFFMAPFLTLSEFYLALSIIAGIRLYEISKAMLDYDRLRTRFFNKKSFVTLFMYVYLISTIYFLYKGYESGYESFPAGIFNYMIALIDTLIFKFGWQGIIFPIASMVAFDYFTDRDLRSKIVDGFSESLDSYNSQDEL